NYLREQSKDEAGVRRNGLYARDPLPQKLATAVEDADAKKIYPAMPPSRPDLEQQNRVKGIDYFWHQGSSRTVSVVENGTMGATMGPSGIWYFRPLHAKDVAPALLAKRRPENQNTIKAYDALQKTRLETHFALMHAAQDLFAAPVPEYR